MKEAEKQETRLTKLKMEANVNTLQAACSESKAELSTMTVQEYADSRYPPAGFELPQQDQPQQ
jgi:hypothetical protein